MLIRTLLPIFALLWLTGCSGEADRLQEDLDRCLMACDSTLYTIEHEIGEEQMNELVSQSRLLYEQTGMLAEKTDTLNLETARKLDHFLAAYANSRRLQEEAKLCKMKTELHRKQLTLLKADIKNGRGARSSYGRKVKWEKEELTKIRRHCNDIRARFEELKTAIAAYPTDAMVEIP